MDFALTDEQQMLLDTTRRLIASEYGFDARARVLASDQGWSRATWRQLADLGLLALAIPEEHGGIGAGAIGTMLVSQAIGEGLLLEPFLASAVVATHVIVHLADDGQRARWLPQLADGSTVAVLAHDEGDEDASAPLATRAQRDADGWVLSGRKRLVEHAPCADVLLVTARVDGGIGVFAVPAGARGMTVNRLTMVDGQLAGDLALDSVRVGMDARLGDDAAEAITNARDAGLAALCAEAVGTLDRLLKATIEYSRTRVQFGVPIGSFQALQHRMADMLMHVEQARSMMYLASTRVADGDHVQRRRALSGAKALIGQAARYVGQQAVQLHGGMGMTDELHVSHCFKRLLAFELRAGSTDAHLDACRRLVMNR